MLEKFTLREKEVLALLLKGYKRKQIAEGLILSTHTVDGHIRSLFVKTSSRCAAELIIYTIKKQQNAQELNWQE